MAMKGERSQREGVGDWLDEGLDGGWWGSYGIDHSEGLTASALALNVGHE